MKKTCEMIEKYLSDYVEIDSNIFLTKWFLIIYIYN